MVPPTLIPSTYILTFVVAGLTEFPQVPDIEVVDVFIEVIIVGTVEVPLVL